MTTICSVRVKDTNIVTTLSQGPNGYLKTQHGHTRRIGNLNARFLLEEMDADCNAGITVLIEINDELVELLRRTVELVN